MNRARLAIGLGIAALPMAAAVVVSAGTDSSYKWEGWVQDGGPHDVCSYHYFISNWNSAKTLVSNSWFYGRSTTSNPGCNFSNIDVIADHKAGAAASIYKDGMVCGTSGWSTNSAGYVANASTYCDDWINHSNTYYGDAFHQYYANDYGYWSAPLYNSTNSYAS